MIISASMGICPLRALDELDARRREITWARYTEITWPSTIAIRLMNHTALAPMMFRLSLYSAVPNMFHPKPERVRRQRDYQLPLDQQERYEVGEVVRERYRHE